MITIPEVVEEIVKRSPYLEHALQERLINLSALARQLKPDIEERLYKNVQLGAIVMALKRLEGKLHKEHAELTPLLEDLGDLTVRSNLVEFTFIHSPTLINKQRELLEKVSFARNAFFALTQGVFETTLIISSAYGKVVESIFRHETLRSKFEGLSSITLILPTKAVQTPGVYYSILKALAWEGINVIEVVSSQTELTIIVENSQVERSFAALKNL